MKRAGCLLLFVAMPLQGQTSELTVAGAVAMARTRAPLVAAAEGRRQVAEGRARTDGAFPNPIAEWRRENLGSSLQPDIFATLQLPIDFTGRRFAIRAAGTELVARGRADSASTIRQLESDVVSMYWRAALSAQLLAIASDERDGRERMADFDEKRLQEGAVAEVVAMRTRLETDRARIAESAARAEAARARAALARAIGMSVDSLPAVAPIPAVAQLDPPPTASAAYALAFAQRSDLAAFRHAAAEADRRATAERRGVVPDAQLFSGYKQTAGVNTGVLGFAIPLPLFSRNEGPRQRAHGERMIANADLLDAENRVRGEVSAAIASYAAIRDAVTKGAANLDARATEIASITEAAYREGAVTLIDLIDAQRARAESRAAAARWAVEIQLAMLELNRATGAPLVESR